MKQLTKAVLALAATLVASAAAAQPIDFAQVKIKTTDLGNKTYMLEGFGGNTTVAVGTDGIIMVDGQFAPLHDKIKAAIAEISDRPIKYLVNTHYHGDHTGGNEAFHNDGVTIVAQDNIRVRLAAGALNGLTGAKLPPAPAGALPTETYIGGSKTLEVGGRRALLTHINNAHTDGDTYVYFADANVLSTGDTVTQGRYPNIDFANGGDINGMIRAADAYLAIVNDTTRIVPGHGPLAGKAQLLEYRAMLAASRDRMVKLMEEGKSEQEIVAAKPFADFDAKWAANDQASNYWIRVVYNSFRRS